MPAIRLLFLVSSLALALVSGTVRAAEDPAGYFQVTELAPDLLMLSTDQGSYSNNSLVFTGPDGLLLVDTHHGLDAARFKEFIDGLGFGAPRYIITTHRHQEHIGGNHLWGLEPIVVGHHLLPERMNGGTYLFNGYPPASFPDITFENTMEIRFNGEVIRLADIGGSHDDNEIMVHFTGHGIAHVSSVVNGFNFPSVDGAGNVLNFEAVTLRLMTLLPQDIRLVSGHHGKSRGFDVLGTWDMLAPYADMMHSTVEIVRAALDGGQTSDEIKAAGLLDAYRDYAGSYVGTDDWVDYVVDALTVPRETRADICKPVHAAWQTDGAEAAVDRYRELLETQPDRYDFHDYVLMSIGGKLYNRHLYDDAEQFLKGCLDIYPDAELGYYTRYLLAKNCRKQERLAEAIEHCRESIRLNPDFAPASGLLAELESKPGD